MHTLLFTMYSHIPAHSYTRYNSLIIYALYYILTIKYNIAAFTFLENLLNIRNYIIFLNEIKENTSANISIV